jgi:rhodanese-related sulfurtransferase
MREITVQDLAERLRRGESPYLLDVRQKWEHDLARLPGSKLLPLDELAERTAEIEAKKDELVVCYCHHGVRSLHAALVLGAAGFADAVSLRGGIDAWSQLVDPGVPRY